MELKKKRWRNKKFKIRRIIKIIKKNLDKRKKWKNKDE